MTRQKIRFRFRKAGDLRLVSHHDLMRCFERMLRRAEIAFHSTEGFNPKPRLVFALSLALGVVGCEEALELELDDQADPADVLQRLARVAPPGLEILSARAIAPGTTARVRRVCYVVRLPDDPPSDLGRRIEAVMAAPTVEVERLRPRVRRIDLRPWIRDIRQVGTDLEIDLHVTPSGGARPEEILGLLGLGDILDRGAVLERKLMELEDETGTPSPTGADAIRADGVKLVDHRTSKGES